MRFLSIVVVLSLACAAAAPGQTYYVSPTGSDSNDGTSQAHPWKTVAKVDATKFEAGSNILFQRGGEWRESLVANSSGADGRPITYAAYGKDSDPKPIFDGSNLLNKADFVSTGPSTYTVPGASNHNGGFGCVLADHKFLLAVPNAGAVASTPNSWYAEGGTYTINTGSDNPKTSKTVYTYADRENIIFADGKSNLVFKDLVARESGRLDPRNPGNNPEAYAIRAIRCSNIKMDGVEAWNGGKHHFGIIDTTGFVGTHCYCTGVIPHLGYGHVSGFVSYSDQSRHGDTSQWIDCKCDGFDGSQQPLYSHGPGMGSLRIQNLTSIGCGFALSREGPNESVSIKGGIVQNNNGTNLYADNVTVDGLTLDHATLTLFGKNNTVENCIVIGMSPDQAIISRQPGTNTVRNNTAGH